MFKQKYNRNKQFSNNQGDHFFLNTTLIKDCNASKGCYESLNYHRIQIAGPRYMYKCIILLP